MLKKAIASCLSAFICVASLLSEMPIRTPDTAQEPAPAASQGVQSDIGLTGANSLARYLARQGTEQAANTPLTAQPLAASAADTVFAVTDLDFDRETGIIQVTSTQSEAVTLRISFIDEDHPANVYNVDHGAAAGEYVYSTFSADISRLPEYFTVRAQIVGRAGLPLSKAFELKTYHREMQEIIRTEISDFASEQVVNFDADETTNFIVLSEDTVRAETTAESNVLVSADYDRNIYVFDHIDDSIRSLEQGQYFYIQPTEDDIISTDIQEIMIDGDTATITGTGEIDDMFDFIKIESESEQTVEGEYHGTPYYGANAQIITDENELNQRLKAVDPEADLEEIAINDSISVEMNGLREHLKVTPTLNYQVKTKWNVYKKFHYLNLFLVTETKVTFNFKATVTTDGEDKPEEGQEKKDHLLQVPIHKGAAVDVYLIGDVDIELSGEFELEFGLQFTKGFVFDSDDGLEWIIFDTEPFFSKLELQGELSVEAKLGIEIKALKGLLKASVTGGIQGTATVGTDTDSDPSYNKTGKMVFQPEPAVTADTVHYDEHCHRIRLEVKLVIEVKVSAGFDIKDSKNALAKLANMLGADKLKYSKTFKKEFDSVFGHRLPAYDIYCSYNSTGDHQGLHFRIQKVQQDGMSHCPHNAYRVTFHVNFVNAPYGTKASLITDGSVFPLTVSPNGTLILYAEPRTDNQPYEYLIMVNGDQKISGKTFTVTDATVDITHTIEWPVVETGTALPVIDEGRVKTGKAVTTVTEPVVTTVPQVFDYSEQIPSPEKISKKADNYDLGENISGQFNNDGSFLVYGYGDMYENPVIPAEVRANIREVVFMDHEPENGLYINDIGNGLFYGAKNLKYVYMPAHITSIGYAAFYGCESLQYLRYGDEEDTSETFVLPDTLESVGAYAFFGCKSAAFDALTMPKTINTIGDNAFEGCMGITSLNFSGYSKPEIGKYAFRGCANMKTALLGDGIQSLGMYVFSNCGSLEEVTLPYFGLNAKDTANQVYAFFDFDDEYEKEHLGMAQVYKELCPGGGFNQWHYCYYLPESLKKLTVTGGETVPDSFFHHYAAETLVLPASIKTIGSNAFIGCKNLNTLQFGSGDTSECTVLPESLESIGNSAFSGCSSLEFGDLRLPESIQSIGANAFDSCEGITSLTIPGDSGTRIGVYAFNGCINMQKAVLCDGIDSIGKNVFNNCFRMEEITIPFFGMTRDDSQTPFFAMFLESDDSSYPQEMRLVQHYTNLPYYFIPQSLKKVTVTGGEIVPNKFFQYNAYPNNVHAQPYVTIETVILPSTVKSIQDNAFSGCKDLSAVYLVGENADWNNVEISETGNEPLTGNDPQYNCQLYTRPVNTLAAPTVHTLWNGLNVQWTETPNADGYQVQYCQDPSFPEETRHTWNLPKDNTECSLTKYPQLGETWYVRVRAFVYDDNTTSGRRYGLWSDSTRITLIASIDSVILSQSVFPFTGKEVRVGNYISVKSGDRKLKYETDFTMKYSDNIKAGYHTASVTVTGVGNYTGTITKYYTITPAQQAKPVLSALSNGIKVQWNTDPNADGYQVQYCQDPAFTGDTLHAGTYTKEKSSCSLTKYPNPGETWYVRVRAYVSDDSSTTGTKAGSYSEAECITIPISISSVELSKTVFPYTGKAVKVGNYITVKSGDTKLKYQTDFTMTYSDNIKAGYRTASVTVTGVGKYTGTITKYYTITPAQQEKPLLSALNNGIRVQWKADPNADGYRVQYCQDPSFTGETLHAWDRPKDKTECSLTKYPNPGETWYVRVRAFVSSDGTETGTQAGTYSDAECIALVNVPVIKKQPVSVLQPIGSTAKFTIEATGNELTYQWQYNLGTGWNNSTLATANAATLRVPVKEERDGQQYRCIVTSANGTSVISDVAVITVNVNITKQPEDVTLPIGQTATFTVEATGKDLTYQWQYNRGSGWRDSTLGTAKTATVSLPVKKERDGQQYRCIITSSNGTSVISNIATIICS